MNGIYVAYMTGRAGTSVLMLVISGGMIVGADVGGIQYDFAIKENPDGSGYHCSGVYVVPAGTILITGAPPAVGPQRIVMEFDLPKDFGAGPVVPIETPLGPVNARFQKLRDL
jgi:hypothetical protein